MLFLVLQYADEDELVIVRGIFEPEHDDIVERIQDLPVKGKMSVSQGFDAPSLDEVSEVSKAMANTLLVAKDEGKAPAMEARNTHISDEPSFVHARLQGKTKVRLVEVLPSTEDDPVIYARIMEIDIRSPPPYEAVSYHGPESSPTHTVLLNGLQFRVSKDLHQAVRRLRLPKEPRALWIKAICVDQQHDFDMNDRAGQIREIYGRAVRTLVWAGEHADGSELLFDHVQKWKEWCQDYRTREGIDDRLYDNADDIDLWTAS